MGTQIDLDKDKTLMAVDAQLEWRAKSDKQRPYIGMSSIGSECERKSFFDYKWISKPEYKAITLKKFHDGHSGEDLQAKRLKLVPNVELLTHDVDGEQFEFVDLGGHYKGHADGIITGLIGSESTKIWEHKQIAESEFKKLKKLKSSVDEKKVLQHWNQTYYGQAVNYMKYSKIPRHYMTVSTPGGRDTLSIRTDANNTYANALRDKASRIIATDNPRDIPRCSDSPAWFYCKSFCSYSDSCHGTKVPDINCRTCVHSRPVKRAKNVAKWECMLPSTGAIKIDEEKQRKGCEDHIFAPYLLQNWCKPIDSDLDKNTITYCHNETKKTFTNGNSMWVFSSADMKKYPIENLDDNKLLEMKKIT